MAGGEAGDIRRSRGPAGKRSPYESSRIADARICRLALECGTDRFRDSQLPFRESRAASQISFSPGAEQSLERVLSSRLRIDAYPLFDLLVPATQGSVFDSSLCLTPAFRQIRPAELSEMGARLHRPTPSGLPLRDFFPRLPSQKNEAEAVENQGPVERNFRVRRIPSVSPLDPIQGVYQIVRLVPSLAPEVPSGRQIVEQGWVIGTRLEEHSEPIDRASEESVSRHSSRTSGLQGLPDYFGASCQKLRTGASSFRREKPAKDISLAETRLWVGRAVRAGQLPPLLLEKDAGSVAKAAEEAGLDQTDSAQGGGLIRNRGTFIGRVPL